MEYNVSQDQSTSDNDAVGNADSQKSSNGNDPQMNTNDGSTISGNITSGGEKVNLETTEKEETKQKKEDEFDEEGLKRDGYDIVLFGTGLTQSILASALTRAGKSVLHCDGNDFYGERDAVFSFSAITEWSQNMSQNQIDSINKKQKEVQESTSDKNGILIHPAGALSSIQVHSETNYKATTCLKCGMSVVTPYGQGLIQQLPATTIVSNENKIDDCNSDVKSNGTEACSNSLAVKLNNWTMADGKSPIAYFGYDQHYHTDSDLGDDVTSEAKIAIYYAKNHDIIPTRVFQFQRFILGRKRNFALDLTPGLLHANGEAVNGLVNSWT